MTDEMPWTPQCGDPDYLRCPECQASRYERHLPPCGENGDRETPWPGLLAPGQSSVPYER